MPINSTDYLRDLSTRIRKVPVCHGVDGYDIDALREVSQGIAELEKANVAYVDANTGLIRENKELRLKLFPYADASTISGISWDGMFLIGDEKSVSYFSAMKHRGEQIDVYKRAYDERIAAKDVEIAKLREAGAAQTEILRRAQSILSRYLQGQPSGLSRDQAINALLGLLDGPDQREAQAAWDVAALVKAGEA